jgi:hypothetical protein
MLSAVLVVGTALLAFSHPAIQQKLNHYLFETGYYNTYGLRNEVLGLELTALIAVLLTVWRAKLNLRSMAACHDCRTLLAYTLMLGLVQLSMATGVLGPHREPLSRSDRTVLAARAFGVDLTPSLRMDLDTGPGRRRGILYRRSNFEPRRLHRGGSIHVSS